MPTPALPPGVATFWDGARIDWLVLLCLSSFLRAGHRVTVFHTDRTPPAVPEGVETLSAQDLFDTAAGWLRGVAPTIRSNLFRMQLQAVSDLIWADSDALCLRPLVLPPSGYLIGLEFGGLANGAILRLPRDSPALAAYLAEMTDPAFVPGWAPPHARARAAEAPADQRLATACATIHGLSGPQAQTHCLRSCGEWHHVAPQSAFNPVPWDFSDVPFNPHGGTEGWIGDDTQVLHLYRSCVHRRNRIELPATGSYIARFARSIDVDLPALGRMTSRSTT